MVFSTAGNNDHRATSNMYVFVDGERLEVLVSNASTAESMVISLPSLMRPETPPQDCIIE